MEAQFRSKKRKQPSPSNPFIGIFTRSKSQIYLHCNRSGRARSDSVRRFHHHTHFERPQRKLRALNQPQTSHIDDISHISIKDLRARRVFSPTSIIDDCCSKPSDRGGIGKFDYINPNLDETKLSESTGEVEKIDLGFSCIARDLNSLSPNLQSITDCCRSDEDNVVGAYCDDRKPSDNGGIDKFGKGFSCKAQDLNVANHSLSKTDGNIELCIVKQRSGEDSEMSNGVGERVQMIPGVNENAEIRELNGEISNGSIGRNDTNTNIDRKNGSISRSKLVVNLSSRRKIFKAPNSFSYRRLLPFLMDIAKDNSFNSVGGSKIGKFDLRFRCKVHNSNDMRPNLSSIVDDCCSGKDEDIGVYSDNTKPSENVKIEKFDTGFHCKAHDLSGVNPKLTQTEVNIGLHDVEQRSTEDGEISNGVDDLMEDHVQMTPPDADIFFKPEVNDNSGDRVDNVWQTKDCTPGKPLNGSISRNGNCIDESFCTNVDQRENSISKSKLVLNPCSRLKVFKTPSSFSYRRLLPFLMDITKDDSCISKGSQCQTVENVLEEKLHLPVLDSSSQEIPIDTSKTDSFPTENHGDTEPNLPSAILSPTDGSSNELNLISAENITGPQMPFDSQKERTLHVEQVISDIPRILESGDVSSVRETTSQAMSLCSPLNPEAFPRDCALEVSHSLSIVTKEDCKVSLTDFSKDAKTIEAVRLDQNLSQLEAYVPSKSQSDGLIKGILKRNPRGCRGLCNCLNCASFRLHADRSFEFSRNQMQDAEEVALELIKELSDLRNMLEKSAVDANDHAVVHVNKVKEACMKTFKAEELAKNCLSQMNYDLNIHCRSMRPRVRFANSIEEKIIPKTDLPSRV